MRTQPSGVYSISFSDSLVTAVFSGKRFREKDLSAFISKAGLDPKSMVKVRQVHGADVLDVTPENIPAPETGADALVTAEPGFALVIQTADCIPAFFWDPNQKVAAVAHAGWRGLKAGILAETVRAMAYEHGTSPQELEVALGPFIRSCCYEVGAEFRNYFPEFFHPKAIGKGMMDLAGAAAAQLGAAGVSEGNLRDTAICTACRSGEFYSVRKGAGEDRIYHVLSFKKTS